jgi:hypothetical protein
MSRSDTRQLLQLANEVHVRFRYDKSPNNFSIRKFRRSSGTFICAVKACISIIQRADLLHVPKGFRLLRQRLSPSVPFTRLPVLFIALFGDPFPFFLLRRAHARYSFLFLFVHKKSLLCLNLLAPSGLLPWFACPT